MANGKVCIKCGGCGPFQKDKTRKDGFHPYCDSCKRIGAAGRERKHRLKKFYNLTEAEWNSRFEGQARRCAICRTSEPGGHGWATDHDHSCCPGKISCGKCVRGILCQLCNQGIGCLKDSLLVLEAAVQYLQQAR